MSCEIFVGQSAIASIVYLVALYSNAKLLEYLFQRFSEVYRTISHAKKRSCVMYVLSIIHTTAALALQLAASPSLVKKYTVQRTEFIIIAGVIVSFLYLFELVYRESIRPQLFVHHLAVSGVPSFFFFCFIRFHYGRRFTCSPLVAFD